MLGYESWTAQLADLVMSFQAYPDNKENELTMSILHAYVRRQMEGRYYDEIHDDLQAR